MSTAFPKNWWVEGGSLGVDILSDSTTTASGGTSIKFPSGGAGSVVLRTEWYAIHNTGVAAPSTLYYAANAMLKTTSGAANKDVKIDIETCTPDRTSISTANIFNGPIAPSAFTPVGGYVNLNGTTSGWIRFVIRRPTDTDFDLWVDSIELKQFPSGALSSTGGFSGAGFLSTWNRVSLTGAGIGNYGYITYFLPYLEVQLSGDYVMTASIALDDSTYAAGDMFGIRLAYANYLRTPLLYVYGQPVTLHAAYDASTNHLGLNIAHGYPMTSRNANDATRVSGVAVEVIQYTNTGALRDFGEVRTSLRRITDR